MVTMTGALMVFRPPWRDFLDQACSISLPGSWLTRGQPHGLARWLRNSLTCRSRSEQFDTVLTALPPLRRRVPRQRVHDDPDGDALHRGNRATDHHQRDTAQLAALASQVGRLQDAARD